VLGEIAEQMRMYFADGAIDVNLDASLRLLASNDVLRLIDQVNKEGKEGKNGKKRLPYSTGSVSDPSNNQGIS
jgi:hypothetical protein